MFTYLPTLKSQKSDSAMRSEQASVASALWPGVQGPAQGPLVGSRGNAPVGVKGAKPPKLLGLYTLRTNRMHLQKTYLHL